MLQESVLDEEYIFLDGVNHLVLVADGDFVSIVVEFCFEFVPLLNIGLSFDPKPLLIFSTCGNDPHSVYFGSNVAVKQFL